MRPLNFYPLLVGIVLLAACTAWVLAHLYTGSVFLYLFIHTFLGLFAVWHGFHSLGLRRTILFVLLTWGVAFSMESLSIYTHLATPYHYTAVLGPRCLGVPVVVPLGWVGMIYISQCMANLMVESSLVPRRRRGSQVVLAALLTALVMTSWDLILDPYMVNRAHAWVWEQGGEYVGIPFANYVSWTEMSFFLSLTYRVLEKDVPPTPAALPSLKLSVLPILLYGLSGIGSVWLGEPVCTRILFPFTMGIPLMVAFGRLLWPAGHQKPSLSSFDPSA